jgi:hypothetical protein
MKPGPSRYDLIMAFLDARFQAGFSRSHCEATQTKKGDKSHGESGPRRCLRTGLVKCLVHYMSMGEDRWDRGGK